MAFPFKYNRNYGPITDGRKGLQISYNILNLPCGVTSAASRSLTYTYLSDGTKVSVIKSDGSGKRYVGSVVYSVPASGSGSEVFESASWDEGRVGFTKSGSTYTLTDLWFVKDHLGNVRTVVDVSPGLSSPQVMERNDYLPYGTRMSVGSATLASNRYRLGGKEKQVFGGLDLGKVDFGARMYDPFTARWTTLDPMAAKYATMSPYGYCAGNPVRLVDPDGRDAIYIAFPDYKANGIPFTGHAGVLLINNKTGYTRYYEYGRYNGDKKGRVRSYKVSNVVIGKDGKPTNNSLNKVLKQISDNSGNHGDIEGAYILSNEFQEMNDYANSRMLENNNPDREAYSFLNNNCATFAEDVITQDKRVDKPSRIINSPVNLVRKYQNNNDKVQYDAKKQTVKIEKMKDEEDSSIY